MHSGKAKAITKDEATRIKRAFLKDTHRLIFAIGWHTTERWGAILKLRVGDVYRNPEKREPLLEITFPARIRKDRKTRQIAIAPDLMTELRAYQPASDPGAYLFPSPLDSTRPLSWKAARLALERATARVGMDGIGISTHSTRRGSITTMANAGIHSRVIQQVTGHSSASVLAGYIEVSGEQVVSAIGVL